MYVMSRGKTQIGAWFTSFEMEALERFKEKYPDVNNSDILRLGIRLVIDTYLPKNENDVPIPYIVRETVKALKEQGEI